MREIHKRRDILINNNSITVSQEIVAILIYDQMRSYHQDETLQSLLVSILSYKRVWRREVSLKAFEESG